MRLAVIVTTYNRPDALSAVLAGYQAQVDCDFELIIADDGSTAETRRAVQSWQSRAPRKARHVWHEDLGFRAAAIRNRAIAATDAEYIVFTDGDCVPAASFVARHRELAEQGWFVAGNRILLSEDFTRRVLERQLPIHAWNVGQWFTAWLRRDINRWLPLLSLGDSAFRKRAPSRWKGIKTCNLAVWREDLIRVNGLDESYTGWGLEDSDLVIRLLHAGVRHKSGRFATPLFHLWHAENDRSGLADNRRRLDAILRSQNTFAVRGVSQYSMMPPASVLIVITRRIGDVLLATPLIRSVKRAWPEASVDALVFAGTSAILDNNPDLAGVITVAERPSFGEHLALLSRIRRRYDLALSLVPGDRPTVYAWAAGRFSIGLLLPERKQWWKRVLLSRWVRFDPLDTHTVSMHLALADALDIPRRHEFAIHWNDKDEAGARRALPFDPDRHDFAVLHCWPKFNYKMWHHEGWIELARHLGKRGLQVVWSGSDAPEEVAYVNSLAAALPAGTVNAAGKLSLPTLGFLLGRARLYVGPDTAVTHMAAALGTPTIALYGPSNPVKWGPWPKNYSDAADPWRRHGGQTVANVRLLQGTGHCVPCLLEGCERRIASFSDCLQTLPAQRVIAAVDDLLRDGMKVN